MSIVSDRQWEQIARATQRAANVDLELCVERARHLPPKALTTRRQLDDRRRFLQESLGAADAKRFYERIINGNELQDVNYFARGVRAARAVAKVVLLGAAGTEIGSGTGFLIAPGVLITNNHVLPDPATAGSANALFDYELNIDGTLLPGTSCAFDVPALFYTSADLDFTVVAMRRGSPEDARTLAAYGTLPLIGQLGKVIEGEWLSVVQHPNGGRKQICIRESQLVRREDDVLWYSTDTTPGSSGSPVLNNDWYVVALHHSSVAGEPDELGNVRWIANEGIRVSRIVETLRTALPGHPLLAPMFAQTPESARVVADPSVAPRAEAVTRSLSRGLQSFSSITAEGKPMYGDASESTRTVTVTLNIDADGGVRLAGGAREAAFAAEAARKPAKKPPAFDVPFDATYKDRKGYQSDFLRRNDDAFRVHLPTLGNALERVAARLLKSPQDYELKYHNFSVVMHRKRRFAIFTAANVDFSGRFHLSRPNDVWRTDPRIAADAQIGEFYYSRNAFDRGHLTRREDLEFGKTFGDALSSAADTCHFTNCTPMHARFNQNRETWQGLERHILEEAIKSDSFRAQVFTGCVLWEDDPVWEKYPTIQYPVRYWKVVAAMNASRKLFATAYLADQSDVVAQFGIEAAGEVPFTAFRDYQVPIAEIERLTGLTFSAGPDAAPVGLSTFDPIESQPASRRRRRARAQESTFGTVPEGYVPLDTVDSAYFGE